MQLLVLALIAWTHAGWSLFLRLAVPRGWGRAGVAGGAGGAGAAGGVGAAGGAFGFAPAERASVRTAPRVSVIVAAYAEEPVIARTVAALRAQLHGDFEVIVACDGSPDATAERAREAGADLVLELPRGGKHAAQAAAVARASGSLLAFCDANTTWEPGALSALAAAFASPDVGYACGHVAFVRAAGETNQEGAYWSHELRTRELEGRWHSVTAGNGAIYALRASLWPRLRTDLGHDLAFPHQVVRAGFLAVDVPGARASELMVPSLGGEWRRKRRMMARMWGIVLRDPAAGGLLDPRGLPPRYLLALASHRWLRYASPALHVVALVAGARTVARGRGGMPGGGVAGCSGVAGSGAVARSGAVAGNSGDARGGRARAVARERGGRARAGIRTLDRAALAAQLAVLAGAAVPSLAARSIGRSVSNMEPQDATDRAWARARPFLLCRYYVLMTASIAAGGLDRVRAGAPEAGWSPPEGTR